MKGIIAALAVTAFVAGPAAAQVNITGKWEMKFETPRGEVTQVLTLQQDGNTFTGTAQMTPPAGARPGGGGGGMGGGPPSFDIEDGAIDGDTVTFSIVRSFGERSFTAEYTGTVDGDTITGTMKTMRGESPWSAVRVETD